MSIVFLQTSSICVLICRIPCHISVPSSTEASLVGARFSADPQTQSLKAYSEDVLNPGTNTTPQRLESVCGPFHSLVDDPVGIGGDLSVARYSVSKRGWIE